MKKHLKRLAMPKAWKVERKTHKWAVKPRAGAHPQAKAMPLLLIVRDVLKLARNSREAKKIINEEQVLIDKKVRKDYKFPVGLMDVIEVPKTKEQYIVLFDKKGRIILKPISSKEAKSKLCRIVGKTVVKNGNIQLNLHDGRNYLVKVKDARKPEEDIFKTKDTLVMDLDKYKILKHLKFKEGSLAVITGGSHTGSLAKIEDIDVLRSPTPNIVTLSSGDGKFQTIEDYVFVVGEKKPVISGVSK